MSQTLDLLGSNITTTTKLSVSDRQKSLRWLSRQNDLILYEVFKAQKNHFFRLKADGTSEDMIILSICSLFLALKEVITALDGSQTGRKNKSNDFSFLKKVTNLKAKQHKKSRRSAKYEKLLNLQSVICMLIDNEGYSFRDVSDYLLKKHRFEVSHTTIRQFYNSLKGSN
jgi:hypothetical protein